MRTAFLASVGRATEAEIVAAARCRPEEARILAAARRLASIDVLDAYAAGRITFRQLWRACEYTGDEALQRAAAHL